MAFHKNVLDLDLEAAADARAGVHATALQRDPLPHALQAVAGIGAGAGAHPAG